MRKILPTCPNCFEHVAVVRRCPVKKMFLIILQNSQENTCVINIWCRCFLVNFTNFSRTSFLLNKPVAASGTY